MDQQTYTTMTTDEEAPEVGPNDIVIHLVNPFKCGMCELEFLDKTVFKEHIFNHLESIKHERPSSQIVMNIVLPPETPGGVTVTRDILQLAEDGSIKQVIQPANSITLNQVLPLKELEAAGVLKLDHSQPSALAPPVPPAVPKIAGSQSLAFQTPIKRGVKSVSTVTPSHTPGNESMSDSVSILNPAESTFIKEEAEDVSEIIENTDGTFSVAFKGPNNEMQHIQIIRPEGMKGDMMLELTNPQSRRGSNKGAASKINECDICGKILSSSTNLIRHKMYHSTERPFVCQTCGKGFKDVSNLKKHTMIHNRIYSCHMCKKSFLRKSLLALHLKRHQARTVFVKSGSGAKEVMLKTFVDDDGTRVEEMSMAALQGQTFEYKKRIMKADPQDVKPVMDAELEASTASLSSTQESMTDEEGKKFLDSDGSMRFVVNEDGTLENISDGNNKEDNKDGVNVEEVPDVDIPKDFVKMYQCGHCGKRTVQRGNMMRHLIHHLRDKPFKCDECPKQFVDKGELVKHIKTHTKPYRCNRCDGAFAHNVQLMKHQESECLGDREQLNYSILDDGQTYRCNICQIEMKRLGNMIKHVGTHTGKRSGRQGYLSTLKSRMVQKTSHITAPYSYNAITRKFQCNHCSDLFFEKKYVHQHIKTQHAKEQLHQCPDCDSWFHSSEGLKKHSEVHVKPFKCDQCSATFAHKMMLESHKRKHLEKEREEETADYGKCDDKINYYCKHCNKKLSKKFRMMNHIRRHLNQRPFECTDCNKCFTTQYMLTNHRKVHAKVFTCETCGEAFTRKLFLQIHRKKHEETIEIKDEYSAATPVTNHKRKYSQDVEDSPTGEYTCKICATPFNRQVIKMNHERKCKEEQKVLTRLPNGEGFQCKICSRTATLKHNLMVHIRKNHADIVKIDPSGEIQLPEEYLTNSNMEVSPQQGSDNVETPVAKRPKLSGSGNENKKTVWDFEDDEGDFGEINEDEEEMDGRYTKTMGVYACNICRRKFTDVDTVLMHFKSHDEETSKENGEDNKVVIIKTDSSEMNENKKEKNEESKEEDEDTREETQKDENTENTSDPTYDVEEKTSTVTIQVNAQGEVEVEVKTPSKSRIQRSKSAKASTTTTTDTTTATPTKSAAKSSATKIKLEKVSVKKEMPEVDFTPTRSSVRPARSQKIPSRFLE